MINPNDVTYGDIIYPPGGKLGPRKQRFFQLVFVYAGTMSAWVDDTYLEADTNTTVFLRPGHTISFSFATEQETHHAWVHISLPTPTEKLQQRLEQLASVIPLSPIMSQLMSDLLTLRASTISTKEEITKTIAAQMMWHYIGEAEQLNSYGRMSGQTAMVYKAQNYINAQIDKNLTLPQIAQFVSLSPAHLIRLFRQELGVTPIEYVWQQRVKIGIELLEQTGLTIKEVASYCGFKTSYHFSRRVKEATGLTPTQVRQYQ